MSEEFETGVETLKIMALELIFVTTLSGKHTEKLELLSLINFLILFLFLMDI